MQSLFQIYNLLIYKELYGVKYLRCNGTGHCAFGFGIAFWKGVARVA
jgi:hypothetical protein